MLNGRNGKHALGWSCGLALYAALALWPDLLAQTPPSPETARPPAQAVVLSLRLQADGKILAGGAALNLSQFKALLSEKAAVTGYLAVQLQVDPLVTDKYLRESLEAVFNSGAKLAELGLYFDRSESKTPKVHDRRPFFLLQRTREGKAPAQGPLRTDGEVKPGKLIRKVEHIYPAPAQLIQVRGRVTLEALINEQGEVEELRLREGHRLLVPEAVRAVAQWQYSPALVNNQPTAVVGTINVDFDRRRR